MEEGEEWEIRAEMEGQMGQGLEYQSEGVDFILCEMESHWTLEQAPLALSIMICLAF